jgi:peptidoglycan/xylan/chitin deacetylase (PgdA/CDA1 family)
MAVLRRAYYGARPAIPLPVRLAIRRRLASAQRRAAFPRWPVDTTLDDLQSCVVASAMLAAGSARLPMLAWWPRGKRYAVILRHDVEDIPGVQNLRELRTIEEDRGLRSIWNFVPERYTFHMAVLDGLREAGHEIGVHGLRHDGREFSDYDAFRRRASRINHYLESWNSQGFAAPSAIRQLDWIAEHLQIDFDMSAPTAEVIGAQPGGCCTVFPFFLKRNIVELPMTMQQDHTLFEILKHSDLHIWHENLKIIRERGGLCVVTSHPDYMLTASRRAAYASFLDFLMRDAGAWIVLPSEVVRWWRDRAASQLILTSDQPRIAGPLAHRGAVAWIEPAADGRLGVTDSPGVSR